MDDVGFRARIIVAADGCATPQIRGQPSDGVVFHIGSVNIRKECYMVYCVEGFGEIHCHRHSAVYGVVLIEAGCYLVDQRKECGGGGSPSAKTMLAV